MSRSPYFFVERFDRRTQQYELQHPLIWNYEHTERIEADLFSYNGCHDVFSIVENKHSYSFPEMKGIHSGLPKDICYEIAKSFEDCSWESDFDKEKSIITPNARWFTYADMYIYLLENPTIKNSDYEEEDDVSKINIPNPLNTLKERVDAFLDVCDDWDWSNDYSLIRIVYWIL